MGNGTAAGTATVTGAAPGSEALEKGSNEGRLTEESCELLLREHRYPKLLGGIEL